MKNLKKVLAFVVVFALMLTSAVSAAAFPDVAEDASYAEAATILSSLGLMIGDDMGNFNPDKILTRAEATALIMRAKGLESASAGAAGATQFTDVAADHWASGYINLAAQSKVVAGYGDGTFGPEDEVKYEQFVKMVVATLGYEPKANAIGGYPTGYLMIAAQKDITKGANGTAGQPAPRKLVAQILFNALDVNMMDQYVYATDKEEFAESDDTLLKDYLNVDKYEGIIESVTYSEANDGYKAGIKFNETSLYINDIEAVRTDKAKSGIDAGITNAPALVGYAVSAYIALEDYTNLPYIVAVAPRTGRNEVVKVDYAQLSGTEGDVTKVNYLVNPTDNNATELVLATDVEYIYNNDANQDTKAKTFIKQTAANKPGSVVFVNNDAASDYDYVFVTEYESHGVAAVIDAANGEITDKNNKKIVDTGKEKTIWSFIKNGEIIDFEDIKEGNVLSITKGTNNNIALNTVYVSDVVVEGAVAESRVDGNSVAWYTIAGEEYAIARDKNNTPITTVAMAEEGKFFINVDGKIVDKDAVRLGSDNYAYILEAGLKTGLGGGAVELKFINAAGEWVVAEVAPKVTIQKGDERNTVDSTKNTAIPSPAPTMTKGYAKDFGVYTLAEGTGENAGKIVSATAVPQLFQYELNSAGKVSKIYLSTASESDEFFSMDDISAAAPSPSPAASQIAADMEYDEKTMKLGGKAYVTENTIVFSVNTAKAAAFKEDGVIVTTVADALADEEDYAAEIYDIDVDGNATAIVIYNANAEVDNATHPLVITKVSTVADATTGVERVKVYGYQAGEPVEVALTEDPCAFLNHAGSAKVGFDEDDLAAGDVVLFSLDVKGDINQMKVLMTSAEAKAAADDTTNFLDGTFTRSYTSNNGTKSNVDTFGYVGRILSNNRVVMNYDTNISDDAVTKANVTKALRGKDVFFYTVNINRSGNFTVSTSSFGDIEASNEKGEIGSWTFVREYEGAPVIVVNYVRTNSIDNMEDNFVDGIYQ